MHPPFPRRVEPHAWVPIQASGRGLPRSSRGNESVEGDLEVSQFEGRVTSPGGDEDIAAPKPFPVGQRRAGLKPLRPVLPIPEGFQPIARGREAHPGFTWIKGNNPGGVEASPAFAPLPGCGIHHDAPFPGCVLRTTRGYPLPSLQNALVHPGNRLSSSAGDDTLRTARASCQSWPSSWIASIRARNASLQGPKRA
jgi:hypothetical protein